MLSTVKQLETFGPDHCDTLSTEHAREWCRRLAKCHYENFTVLSSLVPKHLRDDFAAVYAFCRWADDLGDEIGDARRSRELLSWWRRELRQCFDGEPRHPIFLALSPTIKAHSLPIEPFDDLIRAFEQDQTVKSYSTWNDLIDYCRLSANPVGRLVLMMCGEDRSKEMFAKSDAICTALQLTNHWQDVKRDIIERDRIYIPTELNDIDDFELRLRVSAEQGFAVDKTFLNESRQLIRTCVKRTWPYFQSGTELIKVISKQTRPLVWLFAAGGCHILRQIELWNYETVLHRPVLTRARRFLIFAQAWLQCRFGSRFIDNGTRSA